MTNEEIKNLDFQKATLRLLIDNTAYLRTIIQTQMEILNRLSSNDGSNIALSTYKLQKENEAFVNEYIKNNFPHWWDMKPPMKDF